MGISTAGARLNRARAARSYQATPRWRPGPAGRHIADKPPSLGQQRNEPAPPVPITLSPPVGPCRRLCH